MWDQIVSLLNNFAFPVVCVVALGWYAFRTTDKIIALTEKVTGALTANTEKLSDLARAIESLKEDK